MLVPRPQGRPQASVCKQLAAMALACACALVGGHGAARSKRESSETQSRVSGSCRRALVAVRIHMQIMTFLRSKNMCKVLVLVVLVLVVARWRALALAVKTRARV